MAFGIEVPPVTALRADKARPKNLPAGTKLHRLHPSRFGSTQFNDTDRGNARFSPIQNDRDEVIPTIYAGESFACAACEIVLRCPDAPAINTATGAPTIRIVSPADFELYAHSVVETTEDLQLLDLTASGQRRVGVDHSALTAGPSSTYRETRAWAEAVHRALPTMQGLHYTSHQWGPEWAVVLFGDRIGQPLAKVSQRQVADAPCHDELRALAAQLSIEYNEV